MLTSNELATYLKDNTDKTRVIVSSKTNNEFHIIEVKPLRTSNEQCASISVAIDRKDGDASVHIGMGGVFDTNLETEDQKLILSLAKACIAGRVQEVVVKKRGKVLKSRLSIELPEGKRTLRYRYRPFLVIGNKKIIDYKPYPQG